jgi:hypothetical protein
MRRRVEHADTLTVLRELPSGLAQVCLAAPQTIEVPRALVVLAEARRVLRNDGTLWLWHRGSETLLTGLRELGWVRRPLPAGASALTNNRGAAERLFLFTKTTGRYYYRSQPFAKAHRHSQSVEVGASAQARRAERCTHETSWRRRELIRRCLLAGSSRVACGACGTPYRPTPPDVLTSGAHRPGCAHHNPQGHCLVLDPFYKPHTGTGEIAYAYGRSFLGITSTGEEQ